MTLWASIATVAGLAWTEIAAGTVATKVTANCAETAVAVAETIPLTTIVQRFRSVALIQVDGQLHFQTVRRLLHELIQ